jgi:hypothetical protein
MERELQNSPPSNECKVHSGESVKLRGLGRSPRYSSEAQAAPTSVLSSSKFALTSVSSTSHLSALTSGMSIFAPGFAITTTALKG